jgi:hypothetical protein
VIRNVWAKLNLGKRKRENNGKDCEEESEARPQGEGEAHCAFRLRPPQGEARSSGRSQDFGSPSPRSLSREYSLTHARPDHRIAVSGRSFFCGCILRAKAPDTPIHTSQEMA